MQSGSESHTIPIENVGKARRLCEEPIHPPTAKIFNYGKLILNNQNHIDGLKSPTPSLRYENASDNLFL